MSVGRVMKKKVLAGAGVALIAALGACSTAAPEPVIGPGVGSEGSTGAVATSVATSVATATGTSTANGNGNGNGDGDGDGDGDGCERCAERERFGLAGGDAGEGVQGGQ